MLNIPDPHLCTADCKSLGTHKRNSGKPQLMYPYESDYLSHLRLLKHNKSIAVFHCSACLLQDFCNLLYTHTLIMKQDYYIKGPIIPHPSYLRIQSKTSLSPTPKWCSYIKHRLVRYNHNMSISSSHSQSTWRLQ